MTLQTLAASVGATDLFVLHRVDGDRLVNLDGWGRGAGWAGNLSLSVEAEPMLSDATEQGVVRLDHPVPVRVFGPYWASEAVVLRVDEGVVVFGGAGTADRADAELREAADAAAAQVGEVPVASRLAAELEVTQAALAIATLRPPSVEDAAREIATKAAEALSCEFGAVVLYGPPIRLFLGDRSWRPSATDEEVLAALFPLAQTVSEEPLVEQDVSSSPFAYRPLGFDDGLVARCAARLGRDGELGLLVVAHTVDAARGFTALCQRVAGTVAGAAGTVLEAFDTANAPVNA